MDASEAMAELVNAATGIPINADALARLGWQTNPQSLVDAAAIEEGRAAAEAVRLGAVIPAGSHVLTWGPRAFVEHLSLALLRKNCRLYFPDPAGDHGTGSLRSVEESPLSLSYHALGFTLEPVAESPATEPGLEPVAPSTAAAPAPIPTREPTATLPRRTAGMIVDEIYRCAQWDGQASGRIPALLKELEQEFPAALAKAQAMIRQGHEEHEALAPIYPLVMRCGGDSEEVREQMEQIGRLRNGFLVQKAREAIAKAEAARARRQQGRDNARKQCALSTVRPGAEHRFWLLQPAAHWTLFIDESGADFRNEDGGDPRAGKIVGVAVPQGVRLPDLPGGFHAVDIADNQELDRHLQNLLDAPAGILGLTMGSLPRLSGELWALGVVELVQWALRLLPIPADAAGRLEVLVEKREYWQSTANWQPLISEARAQLALADPARAKRLSVDLQLVKKDAHPHLGYADLVAFTWGSPAAVSRDRLAKSGILGACFLAPGSHLLRKAWDDLGRTGEATAEQWSGLLGLAGAGDPGTLPGQLVGRLAGQCRRAPALWQKLANLAFHHLESKAVNLALLGRQLQCLEEWLPTGGGLPPKARLALHTARLAEASHRGAVETGLEKELEELSGQLYTEDARLVCLADLYRAVGATNRFDFAGAERIIRRWVDCAPEIPTLQVWGRALSLSGQLEAFQGRPAAAGQRFEQALAAFSRLSDPHQARAEQRQTSTYLAIVAMDTPDLDAAAIRQAVERALGGPILAAAERLAGAAGDQDKYAQHLLLRYLVRHGTEAERHACLEREPQWAAGGGHPWPLIQAYRGLLLRDTQPEAALDLVCQGRDLAFEDGQGPTVRLIGTTLAVIGHHWGAPWAGLQVAFGRLGAELPLAADRLAALERALGARQPPLELLAAVLPFNFR